MKSEITLKLAILCGLIAVLYSCTAPDTRTVKQVMDDKVTELYKIKTPQELQSITNEQALSMFSEKDLNILSTRHWMFDTNVPVVVSVFRSKEQKVVPFWFAKNGFSKTDLTVKNEMTEYEVWQKSFPAGRVGLGVNGFENYGLHYFVSVKTQNEKDELKLTNFFPENQYVGTLKDSAFVYHDWDELVLTGVPEELKGQQYLTTIRGRGTESHLVGAFRKTDYPSSKTPDQVVLTWSGDPSTTMDIQWRTDTTVSTGIINYREKDSANVMSADAEKYRLEDRYLMNDRFVNRYTARLKGLKPGTNYEYRILPDTTWNNKQIFFTAAADDNFSFIWFGDTHFSPKWGEFANSAFSNHPDAAFYTIAGDIVSDGLYRDQWDALFSYVKDLNCNKPFMSVLGNHDRRSGLGALMYRELFSYPKNGPKEVEEEQTFAFTYKNALFLMIDCTSPIEVQTSWIEEQLKNSKATWKFAVFHFPPYNQEEPYFNIQKAWVPIFDKYHVDMVFSGHVHYYMRSKPMNNGQVVDSYNKGTAYIISIGIPSRNREMNDEPYAAVRKGDGQYYQYIKIEGNQLSYSAINAENKVIDTFTIKK